VTEKDIKATATVMRDQHGAYAEDFVAQQIHYHRAKPSVSATWKAVLAALKAAAPDSRYTKNG